MNRIEEEAKLEMKVSKERVVTEKSEYTEASHEVRNGVLNSDNRTVFARIYLHCQ